MGKFRKEKVKKKTMYIKYVSIIFSTIMCYHIYKIFISITFIILDNEIRNHDIIIISHFTFPIVI